MIKTFYSDLQPNEIEQMKILFLQFNEIEFTINEFRSNNIHLTELLKYLQIETEIISSLIKKQKIKNANRRKLPAQTLGSMEKPQPAPDLRISLRKNETANGAKNKLTKKTNGKKNIGVVR